MPSDYRSPNQLYDSRSVICDLGYDEVIEDLHSSLPVPEQASLGEHQSTPPPSVGIVCVPNSLLSCWNPILIVAVELERCRER